MSANDRADTASAAMPRLFVDECHLCGEPAYFTGRFARAEAEAWQCALFHCARCRETYRAWRRGLAELWRETRPWILLRHDPRAPADPVPARRIFRPRRAGLERLWHASVAEASSDPGVRGRYTLQGADEAVTLPDAPQTMKRLRRWAAGRSAGRDPESPVLAALARRHDELLDAGRDAGELIEIVRFCRNRRALIDALGGRDSAAAPATGHPESALRGSDWQLIANDLFDRASPPEIQASGLDLVGGLRQLWRYTLAERIGPDGERGFVSFQLRRGSDRIAAPDDLAALARLRAWAESGGGGLRADGYLVARIAAVHARLWQRGREPARITELVQSSIDQRTFELRLDDIDPG